MTSRFRRLIVLVISLLLAGPAAAQYGGREGQHEILHARYGTAERNIDVTSRLQELARQHTTFRLSNATFGTDPHPGAVKQLRIYARGPDGSSRTFEYREGAFVDGALFSSWRGGNWGQGNWGGGWGSGPAAGATTLPGNVPQYQILQARYGTAERNIDVTQRLRDLARQNSRFRLSNATFGTDPHPGTVKELRIYARGPDGSNRTFEFAEGAFVDGALFSGWRGGKWGQGSAQGGWNGTVSTGVADWINIIRAEYGSGSRSRDVTEQVRSLTRDGRLDITVNNGTMATDPAPGQPKSLWVTYSVGNRGEQQIRVNEGQPLRLP
jgi:hypothetical protein